MQNNSAPNVQQAVPFFAVSDMQATLTFYVDGLGFQMTNHWIDRGILRWCWLEHGSAAVMLQEFSREGHDSWTAQGKVGVGVTICFMCGDALAVYHAARQRGISAARPFVGNGLWVVSFTDPDGYRLDFESPTDLPEETEYQEEA